MKRTGTLLLSTVASLLGNASALASSGLCTSAMKAVPAATECRETSAGAVIGQHSAAVEATAKAAEEGEKRFVAHFNRAVPQYVVTSLMEGAVQAALRQAGFKVVLQWLDPQAKAAAMDTSIRRAVLKAVEGKNMTAQQIDQIVAQALSSSKDNDAGVVVHELGHLWFMEAYWPAQNTGLKGHYGGPAPDWLDELAAVLHEPDQMAADRRDQFKTVRLQQPGRSLLPDVTLARLTDLNFYLTREHPEYRQSLELVEKFKKANGGKLSAGVLVLSGAEAQSDASQEGIMFYLQSRVFADS